MKKVTNVEVGGKMRKIYLLGEEWVYGGLRSSIQWLGQLQYVLHNDRLVSYSLHKGMFLLNKWLKPVQSDDLFYMYGWFCKWAR